MNRQPEGVPTGGQFAASAKAEPDVALEETEPSIDSVCEEAGLSSMAPFLRQLELSGDSVRGLTEEDVTSLYDCIGDRPSEAADIITVHDVRGEMSREEAQAHIEVLSQDFPLAAELVGIAFERETLTPEEIAGFNDHTATLIETQISSKVLRDLSDEIDSINEDRCSCGADLNGGEGYDGLCGNCADTAEQEGRWGHWDA